MASEASPLFHASDLIEYYRRDENLEYVSTYLKVVCIFQRSRPLPHILEELTDVARNFVGTSKGQASKTTTRYVH